MKKKMINCSLLLVMVIILSIIQFTGCSQEKSSANQIALLDKNKISVMSISHGNSVTKEFSDKEQIEILLDHLDGIKFSKMSIKQEEEVLDKGKVFNMDTTYVIQLMENKQGISKADIAVISEKELILADSETMESTRTVSYMNQSDDSSLNAVKEIYSLAKKAME
ncbi:hypothetical protein E4K67_00975 [Desulfosporosinus fructosivorans]|uniref:Uncharacterized protein n=1 Tax=Desulfosporosinus fructosivorans TaxID=2018669 RepID=A0A4Z0RCA8_9FIRM|nr:hypothetical protein [Desulfosporosinus fructosivorans]TGE39613.1 hypothetical protein E4K67_00975 [Desulfosporosinus fructosivorans]